MSGYPERMTTVHRARPQTIDLAGSAWPVYKLEALAAGLITLVVLAMIVGSPQLAVLAGAAVAAARWSLGAFAARRASEVTGRESVLAPR